MLKIRRSHDRFILNMGIPIPGKDGLDVETECWLYWPAGCDLGVSSSRGGRSMWLRLFLRVNTVSLDSQVGVAYSGYTWGWGRPEGTEQNFWWKYNMLMGEIQGGLTDLVDSLSNNNQNVSCVASMTEWAQWSKLYFRFAYNKLSLLSSCDPKYWCH